MKEAKTSDESESIAGPIEPTCDCIDKLEKAETYNVEEVGKVLGVELVEAGLVGKLSAGITTREVILHLSFKLEGKKRTVQKRRPLFCNFCPFCGIRLRGE